MIIQKLTKFYYDPLIKNSIFLIMSNTFSLIIGFFFWIIAARYYTQHDIGSVSVFLSGISLVSIISTLGFPTALIFFLPRDPVNANKMINSCIMMSIVTATILSLIWILRIDIWAPELKKSMNTGYIIIFVIMSVALTISSIMNGAFNAGRRSSYLMVKEATLNLVKIFPILILSGFGAMGILISWATGLILSVIIGFILLYELWKYSPIFTFDPIIKNMLGLSIGNYVAGIISYIPRSILPIIIANLVSIDAAGYFFIAWTIASIINTVPQFTANSLLAQSFEKKKLWQNVNKSIRFSLYIIFPGLLLFIIFGKFVLNLFNPNYVEHAQTTLLILVAVSIPLSINSIFNTVRNSQKKVISIITNNIAIAGITILLTIPFLRVRGIEGVAMAYLIANIIVAMTIIYRTRNSIEFISKLHREFIVDINSIIFRKTIKKI